MASITDVAKLAGVSTATVSRVVSAAPYAVSPATRARVLDAARALDYVPNALAQGLSKSYSPVVGVIVHDITDPYFAEVVRGVEDAASVGGFLVVTCSSDRIAERELSYVRLLRSMRAATLIFAGSGLADPALNAQVAEARRRDAGLRRGGRASLAPCRRRRRHRRRQCRRDRRDRRGAGRAGPSPDRVPGRARRRCTSRASGWRATAAGWPTPGSRTTSASW